MYTRNFAPETSGLEEAAKVRGEIDHRAVMDEARHLVVANASTSIPNANGYEGLVAVQHVAATNDARLRTFVFPGAQLEHCLVGTPYRPEIAAFGENKDGFSLYPSQELVEQNLSILPNNPVDRLRNLIGRSVERRLEADGKDTFADVFTPTNRDLPSALAELALHDPRIAERLLPADKAKLSKYLLDLPAAVFMTDDGKPFVEKIVGQRMEFVRTLGEMMLNGKAKELGRLSAEDITPYLENLTLPDLATMLGPEFSRKVAFTFCCSECGLNGEATSKHFVLFDGSIYQNMGQIKTPKKSGDSLKGCKMLGGNNGGGLTKEKLGTIPLSVLVRAGFMLSGAGIYAAISRAVAEPDMTLSIVNYRPARGTVEATAKLWPGPLCVSPKVNVLRDGRDASQWELEDYLNAGGAERDRFLEFAKSIPAVSDGRIHDLQI